jgi:hypothetical protein
MCAFLTLRDKVIKPLLAGVVRPFGRGPKVLAAVDQHYVRLHEELNRTFHRARASLINSEDSDDCLQGPAVGRGAQSGPLVCAACALVAWSSRALLAIRPTACAERLSRGACRPPVRGPVLSPTWFAHLPLPVCHRPPTARGFSDKRVRVFVDRLCTLFPAKFHD